MRGKADVGECAEAWMGGWMPNVTFQIVTRKPTVRHIQFEVDLPLPHTSHFREQQRDTHVWAMPPKGTHWMAPLTLQSPHLPTGRVIDFFMVSIFSFLVCVRVGVPFPFACIQGELKPAVGSTTCVTTPNFGPCGRRSQSAVRASDVNSAARKQAAVAAAWSLAVAAVGLRFVAVVAVAAPRNQRLAMRAKM